MSTSAKKKQILENTQLGQSQTKSPIKSPENILMRSAIEKRTLQKIQETTETKFQNTTTQQQNIYYSPQKIPG